MRLYIFWFLHQTTTSSTDINVMDVLYIFWFLHQTTTISHDNNAAKELYIFWFLHQTTTCSAQKVRTPMLYIFWFLHQTTTRCTLCQQINSCISFDSYIKPQRCLSTVRWCVVVYLLIPTSNHNLLKVFVRDFRVVYLLIPTSNHNCACRLWDLHRLYIFWFLHQTTTYNF